MEHVHNNTTCACGTSHELSHAHDHSHNHTNDADSSHDSGACASCSGEVETSKGEVIQLIIGAALLIAAILLDLGGILRLAVFLGIYLFIGGPVLLSAGKNILKGELFDEMFLMSIATIGAFAVGEYAEGILVMLLYRIGEMFQGMAVRKSRASISALMDIRPDHANVMRGGELLTVSPESVRVGESIVVKTGEKIPLDGIIQSGKSTLDTSSLTGESMPRSVAAGDRVQSGCVNQSGALTVVVESEFRESTAAKILELVENASEKKSKTENFITKFSKKYTPAVCIAAVLVAVVPTLFGGVFTEWLHRALIFLVISCPCALVISVPLSFFSGVGAASKNGVLVKGANCLETLSNVKTAVFDKTGTLTKGDFAVSKIQAYYMSSSELISLVVAAESMSTHPIAVSIREAAKGQDIPAATEIEEIAGHGVSAMVGAKRIHIGSFKFVSGNCTDAKRYSGTGAVYVAVDGKFAGYIVVADEIKPEAALAIKELENMGVKTVMLTGDSEQVAGEVGAALGIGKIHASLLPGDKVEIVESLIENADSNEKLLFVGDGINDAPVLTRADIGVSMGGIGSDAAVEASDVVIMDDSLDKLPKSIKISKKTMSIVRQNIIFALGVKAIVMILGIFGIANMWMAIFADVGVSLIAVVNSMRTLRMKV